MLRLRVKSSDNIDISFARIFNQVLAQDQRSNENVTGFTNIAFFFEDKLYK